MERTVLLKEIKFRVKKIEPTAEIWLYGSRADGTAHIGSDWDILILIDTNKISVEDEFLLTSPIYDLEFETGQIISPFVYTKKQWNRKKVTPFYNNVESNHFVL